MPTTFLRTAFYWENFIYFGLGPKRGEDGVLALTFPMGDSRLPAMAAEDIGKTDPAGVAMTESTAAAAGAPASARTATSTLLAGLVLLAGTIALLWYAPGSYSVYKALHVLAIVVWVGGDVTLTTLGIVFERRRDGETLAALGKLGAWIGVHVYTPVLFVLDMTAKPSF